MTEETYRKASELKAKIKEIKIERDLFERLKTKENLVLEINYPNCGCKDSYVLEDQNTIIRMIQILNLKLGAQQEILIDEFNRL